MYEMATVEHNLGFVHAFRLTLVLPQDKSSFQYVVFLCNNPFTALVAFALSAPRKCCSTQTVTDRIMVLPLSCLRYSKCSSTLCPLFAQLRPYINGMITVIKYKWCLAPQHMLSTPLRL